MPITKENKIHYFIKDESDEKFVRIDLESYMEIPQNNREIKFKRIEDIRMFYSTDIENYECATFQIDFGRNDCHFSGCKNLKEFYDYMQSDRMICNFKPVSKDEFLVLREKAFQIFLEHRCADYSKLEIGCEFPR
jgi:hypothetical protein